MGDEGGPRTGRTGVWPGSLPPRPDPPRGPSHQAQWDVRDRSICAVCRVLGGGRVGKSRCLKFRFYFRLVLNLSENGNYNTILVWINKIQKKISVCCWHTAKRIPHWDFVTGSR